MGTFSSNSKVKFSIPYCYILRCKIEEAIVPQIYNPDLIDIQEMIVREEAINMARQIIAKEGIFAGMSSGAAMIAALRTAEKMEKGNIVVVFPDRAEKYLSTSMFEPFAD